MPDILTERLRLIPLTAPQLRLYLDDPAALEQDLTLTLSRDVITNAVRRAITIKLDKMAAVREFRSSLVYLLADRDPRTVVWRGVGGV